MSDNPGAFSAFRAFNKGFTRPTVALSAASWLTDGKARGRGAFLAIPVLWLMALGEDLAELD
jgi:hypothetical protein